MPDLDEELAHLIRQMAQGRRQALTDLYHAEADRLFGLLMRMVRDRETAADLLHDAFVKLWAAAPRFDSARGGGRTWITTIVRNMAIDHLRKAETRKHVEYEDDSVASTDMLAEDRMIRQQSVQRLGYCIEQLPKDRQAVLLQAQIGSLSYSELSARTGVPVNTIKSWVRRSLEQLRQCLASVG